ncbi:SiaB family protein kinase [Dendrosporobacter sp. 1207_IL3150]|uniref:SiaB family protein kinase n=1 Tax=Dendrosporobacter sp. 1207_IL3150 TaxID=3084054 RepID=UPI002FD997E5
MLKNKLLDLQRGMREHGVLISFSGRFSQGIIEELGNAVRIYMENDQKPKNAIHNVFAIFIEQTQNIKNYCVSKQNYPSSEIIANSGIVTIGKNDEYYFICSGNVIENGDVALLAERIAGISGLDKDALKKLYKEKIRQEVAPDAVGAGIGLIDMARKATQPLEYSVIKLDDSYSYFTLKVVV